MFFYRDWKFHREQFRREQFRHRQIHRGQFRRTQICREQFRRWQFHRTTISPEESFSLTVLPPTVSPQEVSLGPPLKSIFLTFQMIFNRNFLLYFFGAKNFFGLGKLKKNFLENVKKLPRRVRNVNILPRRVSAENRGLGSTLGSDKPSCQKKKKTWRNFPPGLARRIEG